MEELENSTERTSVELQWSIVAFSDTNYRVQGLRKCKEGFQARNAMYSFCPGEQRTARANVEIFGSGGVTTAPGKG
jgi:hypothetical protein